MAGGGRASPNAVGNWNGSTSGIGPRTRLCILRSGAARGTSGQEVGTPGGDPSSEKSLTPLAIDCSRREQAAGPDPQSVTLMQRRKQQPGMQGSRTYTPGPAMSFRTWRCACPQSEQTLWAVGSWSRRRHHPVRDDLVDPLVAELRASATSLIVAPAR
jgi:hypothetical protein